MNIYLIRHGETEWNRIGKVQGREDIPLNDTGRDQARECAKALQGTGIKTIITSPLSRAVETARIIAGNDDGIEILVDEDLIERDFGELSGMTYDRGKYFDNFDQAKAVEPMEKLSKRLLACIHKYAGKYFNKDIVMVSHGAAINSVLTVLSNGEEGYGKTRLKNACISILTYKDNDLHLGQHNLSAEEFMNL